MKKLFFTLVIIFSLKITVFSQTNPLDYVDFYNIENIDFKVFDDKKYKDYYNKKYNHRALLNNFFNPWTVDKQSITSEFEKLSLWKAHFSLNGISKNNPCYQGNYNAFSNEFSNDLLESINQNSTAFPHLYQIGITTATTNVRELPTDEYCLKRIRSAGEGYPFDYFQYTSLWTGTPLLLLSKTKDGLWYFVKSAYSYGWIKSSDIALVNNNQKEFLVNTDYTSVVKENAIVKGEFTAVKLNIGTILPLTEDDKTLIPLRTIQGKLTFDTILVSNDDLQKLPLEFNASNVKQVLGELLDGKYSWGGIDNGRDCSSTLKDFMTPFGIWLPRNSTQQKLAGDTIALTGNPENKVKIIHDEGIPFLSLIYKRGHIMLYIGTNENDEPLIFQNVWGLKPRFSDENLLNVSDYRAQYGVFGISRRDFFEDEVVARYIIGKAVITTIEPEKGFEKFSKVRFVKFIDQFLYLTNINQK